MKRAIRYPRAIDSRRVGKYPALAKSGAGYFWDEVLEYRVWCHSKSGGADYYYAFEDYPSALAFSRRTTGAEEPLVLIRQLQHINEPEPGQFIHIKKVRVAEWRVEWLKGSKRTAGSILKFLARHAPDSALRPRPTSPQKRGSMASPRSRPKRRAGRRG